MYILILKIKQQLRFVKCSDGIANSVDPVQTALAF